jgi:hypothetical protein
MDSLPFEIFEIIIFFCMMGDNPALPLRCVSKKWNNLMIIITKSKNVEKEREKLCDYSAKGDYLEMLQWARANGCPWNEDTCSNAAGAGHLHVLQWVRANGCPWNERTCVNAAWGKHFEVLQWTRANGCPE